MLGDGFVHKNIVGLTCKDEAFARSFYECLEKMGLNPTIWFGNVHKGEKYWHVAGYSSFLVKWFKRLSLSDIESFLGDNLALIKAFVRGFYESEGCYSINEKKRDFCIKAYNSDFGKINLFVRLVKKLGFQCSVYRYRYEGRGKSEYSIRIGRKSIVKRFLEVVNPCIKIGELRKR
jgi:intein-encoded DNA endonuclease-like protein